MSAVRRMVVWVRNGGENGKGHVSRSITLARAFSGRRVEMAGLCMVWARKYGDGLEMRQTGMSAPCCSTFPGWSPSYRLGPQARN